MDCQACGQTVTDGEYHDYISCVIHRWETAGYEPSRIPRVTLKDDMQAVVRELRLGRGRVVRATPRPPLVIGDDE